MYPAPFAYERPTSLGEAITALAADDARVLAGGHSLLTAVKSRATTPGTLVDVSELPSLAGVDRDDDGLWIGAASTYAALLADERVATVVPMLADALASIGDPQIRNRGTVGGNLVQADLGADLPPVALVADAVLTIHDEAGEHQREISDLYGEEVGADHEPAAGLGTSALLTGVEFPASDATGSAYVRRTHPATGYATVGVAARLWLDGDMIEELRLGATGLCRRPIRLTTVESAVRGQSIEDAASLATAHAPADVTSVDVHDDPNVSGSFRRTILGTVTAAAIDRASGVDE